MGASMVFGKVALTDSAYAELPIPDGCVSLAVKCDGADVFMFNAESPSDDTESWNLADGVPEAIEERLLAGYSLWFKSSSGNQTLKYRAIVDAVG